MRVRLFLVLILATVAPAFAEERLVLPVAGEWLDAGRPGLPVHLQAGRDILDADSTGLAMRFSNLSVRTPGGCLPTSFLYRGQATC